jgi:hypothetical protein
MPPDTPPPRPKAPSVALRKLASLETTVYKKGQEDIKVLLELFDNDTLFVKTGGRWGEKAEEADIKTAFEALDQEERHAQEMIKYNMQEIEKVGLLREALGRAFPKR